MKLRTLIPASASGSFYSYYKQSGHCLLLLILSINDGLRIVNIPISDVNLTKESHFYMLRESSLLPVLLMTQLSFNASNIVG